MNGRSIMGIMMLAAEQGSTIDVTTVGPAGGARRWRPSATLVDASFNEPE